MKIIKNEKVSLQSVPAAKCNNLNLYTILIKTGRRIKLAVIKMQMLSAREEKRAEMTRN